MSDTPEPYVRRNANDLIRAADWNDIQIKTREELRTHTHAGGAQGVKLTGDAIDPAASLTVQNATIGARLTVRARELLAEIDTITARVTALQTASVARSANGGIALADKELLLRAPNDANHGLRYAGSGQPFASLNTDGPALYGYSGGVLGTTSGQQRAALSWDVNGGVSIGGRVGIGTGVSTNQLDISNGARSGTHGANLALYATVNSAAAGGGVEFRHLNGTQGIGFGHNTIYATGSNPDQDLTLQPRGTGSLTVTSGLRLGNSDLYFTRTDHNHTGIGNTAGFAAIENSSQHNALMILGRSVTTSPLRRVVMLWDFLLINGNLEVSGTINAKKFDIAERFPAAEALRAGDVVVFDSGSGTITPCERTTDTRVVGIVSEAAGLILGDEPEQPAIALCGRVPCKVDADIAPIAPGDLLTTSPTRGHAQKADPARATGAIIGKALEGRDSGRGEILVFVSMQ